MNNFYAQIVRILILHFCAVVAKPLYKIFAMFLFQQYYTLRVNYWQNRCFNQDFNNSWMSDFCKFPFWVFYIDNITNKYSYLYNYNYIHLRNQFFQDITFAVKTKFLKNYKMNKIYVLIFRIKYNFLMKHDKKLQLNLFSFSYILVCWYIFIFFCFFVYILHLQTILFMWIFKKIFCYTIYACDVFFS